MENRPIHILLVEDNRGYATVVQEMLSRVMDIPYNFKHAERLSTGLKHLETNGTDVVLLDLGLPDSKGLDTFVKVYDHTPKVPIIVMTVNHNDALAVEAIKAGAQDYLVKGQFDGQVLGRAIQFAIERNRVEEALKGENVFLRYVLDSPSPISVMYTDMERIYSIGMKALNECSDTRPKKSLAVRKLTYYIQMILRKMRSKMYGYLC